MNDEQKKRLQQALSAGLITKEQAAVMLGNTTPTPQFQPKQQSDLTMANNTPAVQQPSPELQKSLAQNVGEFAIKNVVAPVWNPIADAVNKTTEANKKLPNSKGDIGMSVQNALSQTGNFAKNTLGSPEFMANAASLAVPYGKAGFVGSKFIVPGAVQGALRGVAEGGTPEEVVGDALIGAGTGAVLQRAGKVLGGLKGKGDTIRKAVVKPDVQASPFMAEDELNITSILQKHGAKGSAEAQKQRLPSIFRKLTTQIQDKLKSEKPLKTANIVREINDSMANHPSFIEGEKVYENQKTNLLNKFLSVANKGKTGLEISAVDVYKAKQNLNKEMGSVFTKLEKGATLNPKEETRLAFWSALDDIITNNFKGVKDLSRDQSVLFKASTGIQRQANKSLSVPFIGNVGTGANEVIQGAQDATGRALQGVGGVTQNLTKNIPENAKRAGVNVAVLSQTASANQPQGIGINSAVQSTPTGTPNQGMDTGSATMQDNKSQYITGYSPDDLGKAWAEAYKAGDTKAATRLKVLYDAEVSNQKNNPSSAGGAKLQNAKVNVDMMEKLYKQGNNGKSLSLGSQSVGVGGAMSRTGRLGQTLMDQKYVDALNSYKNMTAFAAGLLNQARGAGVLNAGEFEVMMSNMPNEYSSETQADNWFKNIRIVLSKMNSAGISSSDASVDQ